MTRSARSRGNGARFKGSNLATHGNPDATWTGTDDKGHAVTVRCWGHLHLKMCRAAPITAVCFTRAAAAGTNRDPRETWFWWLGGQPLPLAVLTRLYPRRFGLKHGYRFDKQDLLWAAAHLRTPEHMECWTGVVNAVHHEIGLARDVVQAQHRPWEATTRPLTPRQTRRRLGRTIAQVGTPAAAPSRSPQRLRAPRKTAPRCLKRTRPPSAPRLRAAGRLADGCPVPECRLNSSI